jgi:hypothetical protein
MPFEVVMTLADGKMRARRAAAHFRLDRGVASDNL